MYEKRLAAVPPQLFTADGTVGGQITIAEPCLFKVKQQVILYSSTQGQSVYQIMRIDDNVLYVADIGGKITDRADVSAFKVANGANISAVEQNRSTIPEQEVERLTYEEEPVVARRVILVDQCGDKIGDTNPLPVTATFSGNVQVGDVRITAYNNDPTPGSLPSSVRISDGTNQVKVNPDGSLNVIVESGIGSSTPVNQFNAITSAASGISTLLLSYTVPVGYTANMFRIEYGGDNIGQFDVHVNSALVARRRTYFGGELADTFEFAANGANGYPLNAGDIVQLYVLHNRPFLGNFEARIQLILI